MQVAHQNDHVTHAVIGGAAAIEFGISNSAEFFNILSSTLYKDQILAVVREVLCNAWDAHIEAGCTDKPVAITLTTEKFLIRDFGNGIHRDDMGLIYGTYGNSTKKNDGKQTGGFGLGCKAPFAYTDHFEVTSYNDKIKTIYNLSKSSAQAQGKPGIVPIASFPTEDTGLQVSIPILTRQDYNRFAALIRRIASNGDMNMMLNGELISKIGFDTTKTNYLLTTDREVLDSPTSIMVRYGNVIYPVDVVPALRISYLRITEHLVHLNRRHMSYMLILQAPPHSISVTPSRESLSMQEHTVNTLRTLIDGFVMMLSNEFVVECASVAEGAVTQAVSESKVSALLSRESSLPAFEGGRDIVSINDLGAMAKRYMAANYPSTVTFRKEDITFRLKSMVTASLLNRGTVQSYLREVREVNVLRDSRSNWLQRRIIAPLVTKMMAAGIEPSKLYAHDPDDRNVPENYTYRGMAPLVPAVSISPKHLFANLPYLRNIVVISTSKTEISMRAFKHDLFIKLGKYHGFLFYHASMKKKERDDAIAFFNASGMVVVDLTVKQEWEVDKAKTPTVPRINQEQSCLG